MSIQLTEKEIFDCKVKQAVVRYAIGGPVTLEDVLKYEAERTRKLESELRQLEIEVQHLKIDLGYRTRTSCQYRPWYRRIFS